jgi:hypothetical protein
MTRNIERRIKRLEASLQAKRRARPLIEQFLDVFGGAYPGGVPQEAAQVMDAILERRSEMERKHPRYPELSPADNVIAQFIESDLRIDFDVKLIERLVGRVPPAALAAACSEICKWLHDPQTVARIRKLTGVVDSEGRVKGGTWYRHSCDGNERKAQLES